MSLGWFEIHMELLQEVLLLLMGSSQKCFGSYTVDRKIPRNIKSYELLVN